MLESPLLAVNTSRRYLALLVTAHVLAAFALLVANIPSVLAAVLFLLVGASAARCRRQIFWRQLRLSVDGRFAVTGDDGRLMETDVSGFEFASWLILRYADGRHTRMLVLARDSFFSEDDYRCCRRWFRWRSSGAPA